MPNGIFSKGMPWANPIFTLLAEKQYLFQQKFSLQNYCFQISFLHLS